jgi:hypothetical protein
VKKAERTADRWAVRKVDTWGFWRVGQTAGS